MKFIALLTMMFSLGAFAQGKNTTYEYKKFEKFDFSEIGVEGEAGSPGDLSISPRLRNEFKNKLPERTNFNKDYNTQFEN